MFNFTRKINQQGWWLLPPLSAVLFAACFPPFNYWVFAFIAFVPLLIATITAKNSLQARGAGFIFGLIVYSLTLNWFEAIFQGFALILWTVLALFPALFTWVVFLVAKRGNQATATRRSGAIALIFAPIFWLGIEYFRSECWWLKFAWITPGFSQATNLPLLQSASIVGVYGISLIILAVNSSVAYLFLFKKNRLKVAISTIIILGLIYLWGSWRLPNLPPGKISVGAIQTEASSLIENTKLAQELAPEAKLIVFPEYALLDYFDLGTETFAKLSELARATQAYLVVGGKEKLSDNSSEFYNAALLLSPTGAKIGSYYKVNPVQYFADGIPGKEFPVFPTEIGKIGIAICYDLDFAKVLRNLVKNGAEILAIPTYDAIWWTPLQHYQHSAMAPPRAVESGRWIIRSASSGISQIIDPYGRIQTSLGVGLTGVIAGKIEAKSELTFYVRFGYLLPKIALVFLVCYLAYELILAVRKIL